MKSAREGGAMLQKKLRLARRVLQVRPSPTLAVDAKVKALKAQGVDIVGFGAGEPDFDTPDNIKEAGIKAIRDGFTKYCPVAGTPELIDAIIGKLKNDNGLTYERNQIIVSCGAKHSIYNVAQALFQKGDEVIIPAPYWVSYPDIVLLAEATPKIVKATEKTGFRMTGAQLRRAITPKTRAIIINSPSNPTGACYSREELEEIAEIAVKNDLYVITDDIYEKFLYDGATFTTIASLGKEIFERTIVVNGVSKAYAMTGWRIGYAAGPKPIIEAMTAIQSQCTSNPTSISLKASTEALKGSQDSVERMRQEFEKRRNYIVERLNKIPGISCLKPQGAFYAFPNVSGVYGKSWNGKKITNSTEFTEFLLENAKVGVVPGIAFGDDRCVRLSYAASMETITKGLDRIESSLK